MRKIHTFVLAISMLAVLQVSAQSTPHLKVDDEANTIENFQLPTFSELSNDIASEYNNVLESLPNLSNIGTYVDREIRRGFPFEHGTVSTVRNFSGEHSILPNISARRFELRNNLNNIMFTGFDANQLHLNESYKGTH